MTKKKTRTNKKEQERREMERVCERRIRLAHCAKDGIVTADARPMLVIVGLGVAHLIELGCTAVSGRKSECDGIKVRWSSARKWLFFLPGKHGTTEPDSVTLHVVRDDLHVNGLGLDATLPQTHNESNVSHMHNSTRIHRFVCLTPERTSLRLSLTSTLRLTSRIRRRPKSLNMVEPPLSTIFLYNPRRTSMGQLHRHDHKHSQNPLHAR